MHPKISAVQKVTSKKVLTVYELTARVLSDAADATQSLKSTFHLPEGLGR